tara:strand:- start:2865 stop:3050 length:186 start_codon:yes stop_codon:yes gene_type:complete
LGFFLSLSDGFSSSDPSLSGGGFRWHLNKKQQFKSHSHLDFHITNNNDATLPRINAIDPAN